VGGDRFDEAIVAHVRRRFGCLIGDSTAERIKQEVGCVWVSSEQREIDVRGRHLAEGVPRTFTLGSADVMTALEEPVDAIIRAVRMALEQSPPELAADIAENGIVLTGGGALLRDLDARIAEETGLPVVIAEDPLTCFVPRLVRAQIIIDDSRLKLTKLDARFNHLCFHQCVTHQYDRCHDLVCLTT
jgi:rod shape-determining protein MreB